eukprot:357664-Chlamydomonas_euryale.AAC.1
MHATHTTRTRPFRAHARWQHRAPPHSPCPPSPPPLVCSHAQATQTLALFSLPPTLYPLDWHARRQYRVPGLLCARHVNPGDGRRAATAWRCL